VELLHHHTHSFVAKKDIADIWGRIDDDEKSIRSTRLVMRDEVHDLTMAEV
jgi:hypothetical protein